jgi:hypothetical protein
VVRADGPFCVDLRIKQRSKLRVLIMAEELSDCMLVQQAAVPSSDRHGLLGLTDGGLEGCRECAHG